MSQLYSSPLTMAKFMWYPSGPSPNGTFPVFRTVEVCERNTASEIGQGSSHLMHETKVS